MKGYSDNRCNNDTTPPVYNRKEELKDYTVEELIGELKIREGVAKVDVNAPPGYPSYRIGVMIFEEIPMKKEGV